MLLVVCQLSLDFIGYKPIHVIDHTVCCHQIVFSFAAFVLIVEGLNGVVAFTVIG